MLAGALTLSIMVLPYIISTSEEAIKAVPYSFKEASLACGATKWQTIRKVVLPTAMPGYFTGVILGTAKVSGGECSDYVYRCGVFYTRGSKNLVRNLSWHCHIIFMYWQQQGHISKRPDQYSMKKALTLILLVLGMNFINGDNYSSRQRKKKAW